MLSLSHAFLNPKFATFWDGVMQRGWFPNGGFWQMYLWPRKGGKDTPAACNLPHFS